MSQNMANDALSMCQRVVAGSESSANEDPFILATFMMHRDMQNDRSHSERLMYEHQRNLMMLRMFGNKYK